MNSKKGKRLRADSETGTLPKKAKTDETDTAAEGEDELQALGMTLEGASHLKLQIMFLKKEVEFDGDMMTPDQLQGLRREMSSSSELLRRWEAENQRIEELGQEISALADTLESDGDLMNGADRRQEETALAAKRQDLHTLHFARLDEHKKQSIMHQERRARRAADKGHKLGQLYSIDKHISYMQKTLELDGDLLSARELQTLEKDLATEKAKAEALRTDVGTEDQAARKLGKIKNKISYMSKMLELDGDLLTEGEVEQLKADLVENENAAKALEQDV